jgi:hypothetical protein
MAADVVFTNESPWYANSSSWNRITAYALRELDASARGEYEEYVDVLGVDFTFLPDAKAAEVALWLSGVIERMLAAGEIGASEADRAHAEELLRKLYSEIQVRDHRRQSPK